MIKRYFLALTPPDEDKSTSRIVKWIDSHCLTLASNCTLLTSRDIAKQLRAIEEDQTTSDNASGGSGNGPSRTVDIETLTTISSNPLECVHLPFGDDSDDDDGTGSRSNNNDPTAASTSRVDRMADLIAVSRILASPQDFVAVAYFYDACMMNTTSQVGLLNLQRACTQCNIPIATNEVTATLCLQASTSRRLAVLLFNPVAGQRPAKTDLKEIYKLLGNNFNIKTVYTEKNLDVAEQAHDVVNWILRHKERYLTAVGDIGNYVQPLLIASGGDGTVSAIAGATMNSGITVGVIPRGTCNAFSAALQIPTDVPGACQNILRGEARQIDGATVTVPGPLSSFDDNETKTEAEAASDDAENNNNSNRTIAWINHAGLGFEAGLVDNTTRELKDVFGNFGYTIGAAKQILSQQPFECTFQIDDDPLTEQTISTSILTIGNVDPPSSIFAQGFGQVIPDDGLFEVTIGTAQNPLASIEGLAALAISAFVKDSVGSDKLLCLKCRKIKVSCSPLQKMLLDGEVVEVGVHPVVFECKPKALKVLAPIVEVANERNGNYSIPATIM